MAESEKELSGKNRRLDWQSNHVALEQCILRTLKEEKRFPTYKEMELETGLSQVTIAKHSKELDLTELRSRSRLLGAAILERQALRAFASGDHNEVKTYFKLNYDWQERQDLNVTVSRSAYVGRSIKELSDEEFKKAKAEYEAGRLTLRDGIIIEAEYKDNDGDHTTRPA